MTKEERWIFVTQWSLPKKETLRILIPGIFGYRMVDGENRLDKKSYWGAVAQSPGYEEPGENYHKGLARHSGSGEYSGIFVLLIAIFAIGQSFRKQNSPFTLIEKRFVWFWSAIALISLLFAFGRHAPFFQVVFALPFISSIRNTLKHLNFFHIALLILFGYGLESMVRRYFDNLAAKTTATKNWITAFEKKWILFSSIALGAGVLGWMSYAASKAKMLRYLETHFPRETAAQIAEFSMGEVGWFVLFFAASVVLVLMILRGKFAGKLKLASFLMGALIVADLAHADVHWIVYQNYKEKYASNPIVEILRDKPYEHRVIGMLPFGVNDALSTFQQYVYYTEWLQHHFLYYNIQAIDVAQEPRVAADNAAYRNAFRKNGLPGLIRMWQLANVKYMIALGGGFVDSFNQQVDPVLKRFKLHTAFNVSQERLGGPYQISADTNGQFALIEIKDVLPRAKLYRNWQVVTNDDVILNQLADPAFDPLQTVLVANSIPPPSTNNSTNLNTGAVQITGYRPKRIELVAKVEVPSVLLLNDKHDSKWKVFVDGKEKPLLRANYIMRGVQLDSGEHKIEFRFEPPLNTLYISLVALGIGLAVCAFVAFGKKNANTGVQ